MSKRILITSTELMMLHFLVPHVNHLLDVGYDVELACSEVGGRFAELEEIFQKKVNIHKVLLFRSPIKLKNFVGFHQLKKIIDNGSFDLVWTNEPVMGVVTRLAAGNARRSKTRVMYIAHGFHFYDGCPKWNWMLYYPIEKRLSKYTDVIGTINKEDYKRAKDKFYAQDVRYIHGIGFNTTKFSHCKINKEELRESIGVPKEAFMLLSVGELSDRKNHVLIINALGELKKKEIYYVIAGRGDQTEYHKKAIENGIEKNLILLGNRSDIAKLCKAADVFVHPSAREGLGIAALEGMASGLPMISTNVNGMRDYVQDGVTGCVVTDKNDIVSAKKAIEKMYEDTDFRMTCGRNNMDISYNFDLEVSVKEVEGMIKEQIG